MQVRFLLVENSWHISYYEVTPSSEKSTAPFRAFYLVFSPYVALRARVAHRLELGTKSFVGLKLGLERAQARTWRVASS